MVSTDPTLVPIQSVGKFDGSGKKEKKIIWVKRETYKSIDNIYIYVIRAREKKEREDYTGLSGQKRFHIKRYLKNSLDTGFLRIRIAERQTLYWLRGDVV